MAALIATSSGHDYANGAVAQASNGHRVPERRQSRFAGAFAGMSFLIHIFNPTSTSLLSIICTFKLPLPIYPTLFEDFLPTVYQNLPELELRERHNGRQRQKPKQRELKMVRIFFRHPRSSLIIMTHALLSIAMLYPLGQR
jgi:hypothetical protein